MFTHCRKVLKRISVLSFQARLLVASVAILGAFVFAGGLYLERQQAETRTSAWQALSAIADLKAGQIMNWRSERLGDAQFFCQARFVSRDVQRLLDQPEDESVRREVRHWLELLKGGQRYKAVVMLDGTLRQQIAVPSEEIEITPSLRRDFSEALRSNKVGMTDLTVDPATTNIQIDVIFPVAQTAASFTNSQEAVASGSFSNIAVVMLRLDPRQFLYPLIHSWPTPSRTAETLLVRREGKEVVYLNDLHYKPGAALTLRMPVDQPDLPAALVVRGERGIIEGYDYRGVRVVAVGRAIPGTPWFMVAIVDQSEIYGPLRYQAWTSAAGLAALLLACGLLTALLWRHRTAEELRKTNLELERRVKKRTADLEFKNQELEIFTYSVSHDLKSPLRSIDGFSNILLEDCRDKLDEEARGHLGKIRKSVRQMNQLIDDLLRYSRLDREAITLSHVDPALLVKSLLEEYREEIGRSNATAKVEVSCSVFLTDAAALSQALRNLIGNAVKFCSRASQPLVEIGGHDEGQFCLIWVRDNGIGFEVKDRERVFDIFHRLPGAGGFPGTGVGLAIVRKAMQRIGGRVWAQSEPGKGAIFFLEIPRGDTVASQPTSLSASSMRQPPLKPKDGTGCTATSLGS